MEYWNPEPVKNFMTKEQKTFLSAYSKVELKLLKKYIKLLKLSQNGINKV